MTSTYTNTPVKVSELRADQTNGVLFLSNRPQFTGQGTTGALIGAGTFTAIILDDLNDSWQGHSPLGNNPANYYCQAAGWYVAEAFVPWSYTSATPQLFGAAIGVSQGGTFSVSLGQLHIGGSGQNPGMFAADLVQLSGTGPVGSANVDYVQALAYTSGTTIALQSASPNIAQLAVRWVGNGTASSLSIPANGSFPVPPSFVDQVWLNTNISNAISYLADPPMLRVPFTGTQNLTVGVFPTGSTINLSTPTLDNFSGWSGNAWTVPRAGVHYVYGQVAMISSAGSPGTYGAGIAQNGTVTWGQVIYGAAFSGTVSVGICDQFRFAQGDQVALVGFNGSAAGHQIQSASRLVCVWQES